MNKRITSLLLSFIMVFTMLVTAVPVLAATPENTLMITPDKTEAHPGDTITYTVTLGKVASIGMFQFELEFTEGLEYVAGSATIPDEAALKTQLKIDESGELLDWTEVSKQLMYCILDTENSISSEIVLLTFKAKVSESATTGKKVVTIDNYTWNKPQPDYSDVPITYDPDKSAVDVTPKPVAVTGVTLNKTTLSLKTGESDTLVATVDPNDATNKNVTWYSSNEAVAKVDSTGKVTAASSIAPNKTATATIMVETEDGGKQATCIVTVNCAHTSKTNHPAKNDATCQEQNYSEYNSCDACGQLFKADGTTEISAVPYTGVGVNHVGTANEYVSNNDGTTHKVQYSGCHHTETASQNCSGGTKNCQTKATCDKCGQLWGSKGGHVWGTTYELANSDANKHYKVCTVSGCGEKDEGQTHNYDDAGDMFCNDCNYDRSHHCGSGVQHQAKAADCAAMTDGNILYYECSCGKKYDNAFCTGDPLSEPEITVSWKHTLGHVNDEKYCYKEGVVEHYHCSDCGENFATNDNRATTALATIVAPATGEHDFTGPWTDGNDGKHYHYCQNTGCTNKDAGEAHSGGTATCLNGKICTDCSAEYTDKDAEAHTMPGEYTYEKNNDGTHKKFNKCCSALVKADEACEYGADEICDLCEYDKVDSPQTGDNSNMMLWIALAFISAASLAGLTVYGKKKKYQE